jgi:HAD superfamily hydrolase (TIGR01509 family)
VPLLLGSLALFVGLRRAPGTFGLGFFLARVALGVGLVLLRLTFSAEVVAAGHLSDDLFGLALDTLDGAFDGLLGSTVLSHAISSLSGRPAQVQQWIWDADCVHPLASRAGPSVNAALLTNSPMRFRTGEPGNPRLMGASPNSTTSVHFSSAPAVLFDVDGTLVDSNYLHVHAWQRAFNQAGFDVEAWRIHRSIGMDGSLLARSLTGDQSGDVVDRLKHAHAQFYRQTVEMLRPLPGARALLDKVAALGLQVVLATSAPEDELSVLREVLGHDDILSAVTSSADVDTAKPQPDIVDVALQRAGVTADRAVFVGDTIWDIRAASRAGVSCVCVRSGGIARHELEAEGASAVFDNPRQLLEEVAATPIAALTATAGGAR